MLQELGVEIVLDVGANVGQYGTEIRAGGYANRIVSLEPLRGAFDQLALLAENDPEWDVLNVGASDASGAANINVAGNVASSSLLSMTEIHTAAAPASEIRGREAIKLIRIDSLQALGKPIYLKLDIQGHELAALDGAIGILGSVSAIEIECSIKELYLGQPLIADVLNRLDQEGFRLEQLEPGFHDPTSGAILQFDGVFVRGSGAGRAGVGLYRTT